jgi:hypothetical protein
MTKRNHKYKELVSYLSNLMLETDEYLKSHRKEIVDFVEQKDTKGLKITGDIFDRLVNELTTELPFGPTVDKTHIVLSQALVTSLWCGWLSQAMANKKEPSSGMNKI